ncbi:MAG: glutamine-hydrolyzing carbamoyl-phosphate synthase small subunit [Gammaproteobacteria bacterium]
MNNAILVLADGQVFTGTSIGASGQTVGELIFNTSMSGYQEILTDPSYAQQIITFTVPHVGNVGCNETDSESQKIWATGLVIRDLSLCMSNWRAQISLSDYLKQQHIIGIADIDTRYLSQVIREQGAQNACISTQVDQIDKALQAAQSCPSLKGLDLAKQVSTPATYLWQAGSPSLYNNQASQKSEQSESLYHVVAYDFGVKRNILRLLVDRQCRITVVPAQTSAQDVLALKPDGVFLSNGPGDPAACDYAIKAIEALLAAEIPLFGICLGFQLLALACGAQSIKMKFGHHGANHPVTAIDAAQTILISSQNHGFAIDEESLPAYLQVTHRSLFDNSLQGIRHKQKPAFGFQGHPEASPGPHDVQMLFDAFIEMMVA